MAKTNFTKVEESLDKGLRKLEVEHLLGLADEAKAQAAENSQNSSIAYPENAPPSPALQQARKRLISHLNRDLKRLIKQDPSAINKLGYKKKDLKRFIENPSSLTLEEWEEIKKIQERIEGYKKEIAEKIPQASMEDMVEQERKAHINKRFNIKKTWLPLQ